MSKTTGYLLPDGLSEIRQELPLVMEMIERTARWVHPETFKALPVWYPETARGRPCYDARYLRVLHNGRGVAKVEANIVAKRALEGALGVKGRQPKYWTVCHVWGYDDDQFVAKGNVVRDPRFYSCVGNMVLLPTPLKGFTDAVPQIKEHLRVCAFHLYGWACGHQDMSAAAEPVRSGAIPEGYPNTWPTANRPCLPQGTAPCSDRVKMAIAKRKAQLRAQLANAALEHYPRESVNEVLAYWQIQL